MARSYDLLHLAKIATGYHVTGVAQHLLHVADLSSRLEGLSKVYGTEILASEDVCASAGPSFEWRTVNRVAVVGRKSGTLVCELLGERGKVDPELLHARNLYERGLAAYLRRDFGQAIGLFGLAHVARSGDTAAALLQQRAAALYENAPAEEWDGTYQATPK